MWAEKEKQIILLETLTIVQERKGKTESVDAALLSMGLLWSSCVFWQKIYASDSPALF